MSQIHHLNETSFDFIHDNDKRSYSEVDLEFAQAKNAAFFCLGPQKRGRKKCHHAEKTPLKFQNNHICFAIFTSAHDVTILTLNVVTQLCFTQLKKCGHTSRLSKSSVYLYCADSNESLARNRHV